jgi:hypothetical protein
MVDEGETPADSRSHAQSPVSPRLQGVIGVSQRRSARVADAETDYETARTLAAVVR